MQSKFHVKYLFYPQHFTGQKHFSSPPSSSAKRKPNTLPKQLPKHAGNVPATTDDNRQNVEKTGQKKTRPNDDENVDVGDAGIIGRFSARSSDANLQTPLGLIPSFDNHYIKDWNNGLKFINRSLIHVSARRLHGHQWANPRSHRAIKFEAHILFMDDGRLRPKLMHGLKRKFSLKEILKKIPIDRNDLKAIWKSNLSNIENAVELSWMKFVTAGIVYLNEEHSGTCLKS